MHIFSFSMCLSNHNYPKKRIKTDHQPGHYANMSVQYTAIFHVRKNDDFQMKIFDIFLIFAQNIDCGYTFTIYVLEQK